MAGSVSTKYVVWAEASFTSSDDLASDGSKLTIGSLLESTIAATMDRVYADTATTTTTYDLYDFGGATDQVGRTFALTGVKLLVIKNSSADNALTFYASSSGGWTTGLPTSAEREINLDPGGIFFWYNPDGIAVTDSTDHKIDVVPGDTSGFSILVGGVNT